MLLHGSRVGVTGTTCLYERIKMSKGPYESWQGGRRLSSSTKMIPSYGRLKVLSGMNAAN